MDDRMTAQLTTALADRYAIERPLGSGGMATVYLARDLKHDRLVALKVLRPELGAVLGAERFLSEIRITAQLQHPHIISLIDSGQTDGMLWYVLPYISGESLRERRGLLGWASRGRRRANRLTPGRRRASQIGGIRPLNLR